MECWAQVVATHPVEAVVALATVGVGAMVGVMVRSRLQALVHMLTLLAGTLAASRNGGEKHR